MAWSVKEFERLAKDAGRGTAPWSKSSLDDAVKAMKKGQDGDSIARLLYNVSAPKAAKYKEAFRYFAFNYPNLIPQNRINDGAAEIPGKPDFQTLYYGPGSDDPFKHGDLIYGATDGREHAQYKPLPGAAITRMRFLDDFNNAANLGTGKAFNANWQGYSFKPQPGQSSAEIRSTAFENHNTPNFAPTKGATAGQAFRNGRYQAYLDGLFSSRYDPSQVVNAPAAKLRKHDWRKDESSLGGDKQEQHARALDHARLVRGIRNVCKGGIAMVATSSAFSSARVHFVLDGLGDLAKVATKEHFGTYLPITSSELCFTCRYWSELSGKVYFWCNGVRVYPPWEANWTKTDNKGGTVKSSQESWLRYQMYRLLTQTNKAMPRFA